MGSLYRMDGISCVSYLPYLFILSLHEWIGWASWINGCMDRWMIRWDWYTLLSFPFTLSCTNRTGRDGMARNGMGISNSLSHTTVWHGMAFYMDWSWVVRWKTGFHIRRLTLLVFLFLVVFSFCVERWSWELNEWAEGKNRVLRCVALICLIPYHTLN